MAFTRYRSRGIVLRKDNRGEADQLLSVFTKDFGKVEILARAVRKIVSKLRPAADIFYLADIEFIQGRHYKTLTDAAAVDKFRGIRDFPEKFEIARRAVDVLDSLIGLEERDDKVWLLLFETMKRLDIFGLNPENRDKAENRKLEIIFYFFLWNLLSALGYKPEFHRCVICSRKLLPETFFFNPRQGGIVCWRCIAGLKEEEKEITKEISVDTVKIIRLLLEGDWSLARKLKTENIQNLKDISDVYVEYLRKNL